MDRISEGGKIIVEIISKLKSWTSKKRILVVGFIIDVDDDDPNSKFMIKYLIDSH